MSQGLPPELIYVPGGRVTVGTNAAYLLDMSKQLSPYNEQLRELILRVAATELGEDIKDVREFFIYRTPITNAQYRIFVDKTGWRFPYHWWHETQKEDVQKRLPEINKDYKGDAVAYWERNWKDLPHKMPEGSEQLPVVNVSWKDAQAFAGWAGMRLPTEEEWEFAAKGTKDPEYLLGEKWDPKFLTILGLATNRERVLKPVSPSPDQVRVPTPFGVADLMGNAWEWTANDQGFQPFDKSKFEKEWDKLHRDKFGGRDPVTRPDWDYNKQVCKGGAIPSAERPWELRVDTRAPQKPEETLEFLTFRVAKSLIPGRDMAKSMIRIKYDYASFGEKREPLLADQIGIEHYEVAGKLITQYDSVCLVPVSSFGDDKRLTTNRLEEESRTHPTIIGTLITTVDLAQPAVKSGIYTLCFRKKGVPAELEAAMKEGCREMLAARHSSGKKDAEKAEKAEKKAPEVAEAGDSKQKDKKEDKKEDWRQVVRRFGISEEQLAADKDAWKKLDEITLVDGELKITTKENLLLFRDNDGKYVASLPTPLDLTTSSTYGGAELMLTADKRSGRDEATFKWGVELSARRHVTFELPLLLATKHGAAWRLPANKAVYKPPEPGAPTSNGAPHSSSPR